MEYRGYEEVLRQAGTTEKHVFYPSDKTFSVENELQKGN